MSRRTLRFQCAGITDIGLVRAANQDSFVVRPDLGLFVVADGVCRGPAGALAAALAVKEVERSFEQAHRRGAPTAPSVGAVRGLLVRAFARAEARVVEARRLHPQHDGMVTTLAAMAVAGRRVVIAHLGDSRVYRLRGRDIDRTRERRYERGDVLQRLTIDHNLAEDPDYRDELASSTRRQLLTRVIGHGDRWEVPVRVERVEPGDTYLLCTDGLHGVLWDHQIEPALRLPGGLRRAWDPGGALALPQLQCFWLIDRVKQRGAFDNVTMVVASFRNGRGRWPTQRSIGSVVHGLRPGPAPWPKDTVRRRDDDG